MFWLQARPSTNHTLAHQNIKKKHLCRVVLRLKTPSKVTFKASHLNFEQFEYSNFMIL